MDRTDFTEVSLGVNNLCPPYEREPEDQKPPNYDQERAPPSYRVLSLFRTFSGGSEIVSGSISEESLMKRIQNMLIVYSIFSFIVSLTTAIIGKSAAANLKDFTFRQLTLIVMVFNAVVCVIIFAFALLKRSTLPSYGAVKGLVIGKTFVQFLATLVASFTFILASLGVQPNANKGGEDAKYESGIWTLLIMLPVSDFIIIFCITDYVRKYLPKEA